MSWEGKFKPVEKNFNKTFVFNCNIKRGVFYFDISIMFGVDDK